MEVEVAEPLVEDLVVERLLVPFFEHAGVVNFPFFFLTLAGSSIHLEEQVADSSRQQAAAILELTGQLASVCYIFLTLAGSSIHLEEQVADSSRQQAAGSSDPSAHWPTGQ